MIPDEVYNKIEIVLNSIDNTKNNIEYLSKLDMSGGKYDEVCFELIFSELDSIKSFILAYKFKLDYQHKFKEAE